MEIRENKGLILIIIGLILTISIYGIFFGIPLIIIGTYYLNKKVKEKEEKIEKEVEEKLKDKRNELDNIDSKLEEMEKEKVKEINIKLKEKKDQLDNIDIKLEELEKEKKKEINLKLKDKEDQLTDLGHKLEKIEKERTDELNIKLKQKENQLANIDKIFEEKEKEKTNQINTKLKEKQDQLVDLDNKFEKIEKEKTNQINIKLNEKQTRLNNIDTELKEKKKELVFVEDEAEMHEIGLYEPKYKFSTAVAYKEKLDEIRRKQKDLFKNRRATIFTEWVVDGDKRKGMALTNANRKGIIKSFNLECDMIINKVTYANRENSVKRINKSFEILNRINKPKGVEIRQEYLNLKLQELDLAIEYEMKKQEEREELREAKEREREEKKAQKELNKKEKEIKKQKQNLETEINKIHNELKESHDEEKEELELKIKALELALSKSNHDIDDIAEKRKRTGAGYVYILSNIGSFGENIYKIGVTRRDEPLDRVRELSSASLPFRFDNHVFIFSKEAFDLEKKLHNRFDDRRVNKVNMRKEFFNITIEDVKKIVEENKELVHSFEEKPEAQEYHDTLKIEKSRK